MASEPSATPSLKPENGPSSQQQQHARDQEDQPLPPVGDAPDSYEATHVHSVYEAIAPHFSATRHKPWPRVAAFLHAQRPGSIGLDVGCGNGKYLRVNPAVHLLGSDRSPSLVKLAHDGPGEPHGGDDVNVAVADGFDLPYRLAAFDFAMSIAVVHHMSTPERRRTAIAELLACVLPRHGRVLIFVWALEQAASRRGWDTGSNQDRLVSWEMRTPKGQPAGVTYQRYYHLYREGELEDDVRAVGGEVVESGYERDNWWVVCSRPA